jgi:2-methylcitrate dehydratase
VLSDLERDLIAYAQNLTFNEVPAAAIHQAKRRVLDTLGGALAAFDAPTSRIARRLAQPVAEAPGARVWGSLIITTPESAAYANGTMLRFLDINDTYRTKDGSHPSDNLGGVLATAEMVGANGRDALLALIISYEIQSRFVDAVAFNDAGWDQPIPGAMACALASGRLLGLSPEAMRHALALAVVPNLCTYQTRAGELSMWKGCAAANGARQGVFAARLAAAGMSGPYEAFDGVFGLWNQTMRQRHKLPKLARGKGTYAVQQSNIKMYPVRDSCQLPVNTAKALRAQLDPRHIERIEITTYKSAYKGAVADPELWAPRTRETADHSMLVAIATCLIDGDVTPATFEKARFADADVLDLIGRTSVDVSDEFSSAAPGVRNCRITAKMKDGSSKFAHLKLTIEDIERGPSDKEIETKFLSLTKGILPSAAQKKLMAGIERVDRLGDIGELIDLTRIGTQPA